LLGEDIRFRKQVWYVISSARLDDQEVLELAGGGRLIAQTADILQASLLKCQHLD
jgi:hypothetical protein